MSVAAGEGAIVASGNTSALRGKVGFAGFARTKAVQRIVAESIAREIGPKGVHEASRIDSFLDASLVFARDAQYYLLALIDAAVTSELHARARDGFAAWAGGINQALSSGRKHLVGDNVTLADICFAAELSLFFTRARGPANWRAKGSSRSCIAEAARDFRAHLRISPGCVSIRPSLPTSRPTWPSSSPSGRVV